MPGQFNSDPNAQNGAEASTQSSAFNALYAHNDSSAVCPPNTAGGNGVFGSSNVPNASGLLGMNFSTGTGVSGFSPQGDGARGDTQASGKNGLVGTNASTAAIPANTPGGNGIYGYTTNPAASGVLGIAAGGGCGLTGFSQDGIGVKGGGKIAGHFDGNVEVTGDISLLGADCAEDFDILGLAGVDPGSVMVIDASGALRLCDRPYDTAVAGVVSGAGAYKPAIVLDRHGQGGPRRSIALIGKVYCKADATVQAIAPGDLLTTSATPGHAMKASDPVSAGGAVLGKALSGLADDRGLIPMLVVLQ